MNDPASVAPAACRFRVASAADAAAVHGLFAEYLASLGLTPDAELDADLVDFPAAYTAPGDTFLVAIGADGQLRGMGGIRRGELRRVFVRASQRGRGLARALVLRLLQFGISTGQMQFHGVIARSNGSIREVDLACGLLPTGRVPAHPKQRDCEILAVTRPLVLSRPGMLLVGGTPAGGARCSRSLLCSSTCFSPGKSPRPRLWTSYASRPPPADGPVPSAAIWRGRSACPFSPTSFKRSRDRAARSSSCPVLKRFSPRCNKPLPRSSRPTEPRKFCVSPSPSARLN